MNILVALFEGLTVLDEKTSQALPACGRSLGGLVRRTRLHFSCASQCQVVEWRSTLTSHDFGSTISSASLRSKFASEYAYMLWPIKNAEAFNTGKLTDFSQVGGLARQTMPLCALLSERPTLSLPAFACRSSGPGFPS